MKVPLPEPHPGLLRAAQGHAAVRKAHRSQITHSGFGGQPRGVGDGRVGFRRRFRLLFPWG